LLPALLVLSCAGLPPIALDAAMDLSADPARVYPQGTWQFLHSLQAEMPGARPLGLLGLTVLSSTDRRHRSVLMTLEGFVLFDGESESGRLTVHRALPPFDSPHFAAGLMDDIRLVFMEPEGPTLAVGRLEGGGKVRRVRAAGGTVDVETLSDGGWRIRQYSSSDRLIRTVTARHGSGDIAGFPQSMELTAAEGQGYEIVMTLLEAVPIGSAF
jgi:hypothetical protein